MAERNLLDRLASAIGTGSRRIGEVVSFLFLASVLVMFYEVVARYLFNAPTIWAHEVTIALSAAAFVISGVYTLQRRDHIRISIVYDQFPAPVRRLLDFINTLIMLAFLGLLTYAAVLQAQRSLAIMETTGTASNLPIPPVIKTVLAVGAALMVIQGLAHLWQLIRRRTE